MKDVLFSLPGIALTVFCWGAYGSVLHKGQGAFQTGGGVSVESRLKPLIYVGLAYFVVAIIVPSAILWSQGKLFNSWNFSGAAWSLTAGCAGALGALGIILALSAGGKPIYVMPLVFGCAPVVNVFVSIYFSKIPWRNVSPIFYAGMILVGVGAATVLIFQPKGGPPKSAAAEKATSAAKDVESKEAVAKEST